MTQPIEPHDQSGGASERTDSSASGASVEELRGAKWYTISFLIIASILSIAALVALVWFTIRFIVG